MQRFKSKGEFLDAVSSTLAAETGSDAVISALISGVDTAEETVRAAPAAQTLALNLQIHGWVIRDEDFPVIRTLSVTAAAVAASLATGGVAWPAAATALTEFATLCWQAWRAGGHLSPSQMTVLGFLRAYGPVSEDHLRGLLQAEGKEYSAPELSAVLKSLTDFEFNNGRIVALANRTEGEIWKAARI